MPLTYQLIASNTLTSEVASVTFSAIPNTFTDLVIKMSVRENAASGSVEGAAALQINGDTSANYSWTYIVGNSTTPQSNRINDFTDIQGYYNATGSLATANTFSVAEYYIPNYARTTAKPISYFGAPETNGTTIQHNSAGATLYRGTSAITSLQLRRVFGTAFAVGSSFFLYGIKAN